MLRTSLILLLAASTPSGRESDKNADFLIHTLTDPKAAWSDRCAAEDDLAKMRPEVVLPKLLKLAAKPMPAGGIYNSAGRKSEKRAPVEWQIWYAVGRSWDEQAKQLPLDTGGAVLVKLLHQASSDAERDRVMRELHHRWNPKAEEPAALILLKPMAELHLRLSTASVLVQHGKKVYQDDLLTNFDRAPQADRYLWVEILCSRRNKAKTGVDARVLVRGFELLQNEEQLYKKEVARRADAFHGGYFATNYLADYLDEKFQPNADDPRYNNTGRRDPQWFADTVANALVWWEKNRHRFVGK